MTCSISLFIAVPYIEAIDAQRGASQSPSITKVVFPSVILKAALDGEVPKDQLPERLILISDMEFDSCVRGAELTNFESARLKFERAGYKLPTVVF